MFASDLCDLLSKFSDLYDWIDAAVRELWSGADQYSSVLRDHSSHSRHIHPHRYLEIKEYFTKNNYSLLVPSSC